MSTLRSENTRQPTRISIQSSRLLPNHFMANYLRGLELAKQQKYAEADRIFDRISPGFAAFWAGYYVQGATKLALGQYAQAETSLGKYLAHVPDDIRAARLIATAALQQQAPSRAIEYLKPLVDKTPADAATLAVLGNAYMADRKPDLALQQFEKAAALDPDNPAIKTQIGISEIDIGQGEQGLATLEQVFGTEAGAPIAGPTLVISGTAGATARQGGGGRRLADQARLQEPDLPHPARGRPRRSAGLSRTQRARSAQLWRSIRTSPSPRVDLAQIYAATGRTEEARSAL